MIIELFYTFARIGLFTFGGGYAMISLIQDICVEKKRWITHDEIYFGSRKVVKSGISPIMLICIAAVIGIAVY